MEECLIGRVWKKRGGMELRDHPKLGQLKHKFRRSFAYRLFGRLIPAFKKHKSAANTVIDKLQNSDYFNPC